MIRILLKPRISNPFIAFNFDLNVTLCRICVILYYHIELRVKSLP
jgi:hypothetical protein